MLFYIGNVLVTNLLQNDRTNGRGCPFCSKHQTCICHNLITHKYCSSCDSYKI